MKHLISIWLIICGLLLSGCAQNLPQQESGYGMVAVPYHFINRTKFGFLYAYEWRSREDEVFSVMIKKGTYGNLIVDTAPTGHTVRMLNLPEQMLKWVEVMDLMQRKHHYMFTHFSGKKYVKDECDIFLE